MVSRKHVPNVSRNIRHCSGTMWHSSVTWLWFLIIPASVFLVPEDCFAETAKISLSQPRKKYGRPGLNVIIRNRMDLIGPAKKMDTSSFDCSRETRETK